MRTARWAQLATLVAALTAMLALLATHAATAPAPAPLSSLPFSLQSLASTTRSSLGEKLSAFELAFVDTEDFPFAVTSFTTTGFPMRVAEATGARRSFPASARVTLHVATSAATTAAASSTAAAGAPLTLSLRRNDALFHPNYTETRQVWAEGEHIHSLDSVKTLAEIDICYYHATLATEAATTDGDNADNSADSGRTSAFPPSEPLSPSSHAGFATMSASNSGAGSSDVFAFDACSGGLSGFFRAQSGSLYSIRPALDHLSAADIATALPKLRAAHARRGVHWPQARSFDLQSALETRPRGLHVVYRLQDTDFTQTGSCGVDVESSGDDAAQSHFGVAHDAHSHGHEHDHNDHSASETAAASANYIESVLHDLSASAAAFSAAAANPAGATAVKPSSSSQSSPSSSSSSSTSFTAQATTEAWIELLLASDHRRYLQHGSNTEQSAATLANTVSALYVAAAFTPPIRVVLVAQVTFATGDPWPVTLGSCTSCASNEVGVSDLLSKWNSWRSDSTKAPAHDSGHLLSGYDFESQVLGYAGVGAMCSTAQSGGIDQTVGLEPAMAAAVVAHELGHNLGSRHDSQGNDCPARGYIMNAIISLNQPPTEFSTCTHDTLRTTVDSRMSCLWEAPTKQWNAQPTCGNGLVEEGEQCDCGQVDCSSVDACCDGSTCTFVPGATCSATQPCCDSCSIVAATSERVCRAAFDPCDLPEKCDGASAACPTDLHVGPGVSCRTAAYGAGLCYDGTCRSHLRQCREDTASFTGGPYSQCPSALQRQYNDGEFCGVLYCQAQTTPSDKCGFYSFGGVVLQVADGVPCTSSSSSSSTVMQCYAGECVASTEMANDFEFVLGDWSECTQCDEPQTRTVACRNKATKDAAADASVCGDAASAGSRKCVNHDIGCYGDEEQKPSGVAFFGHRFPRWAVGLVITGIILFCIAVLALCTYCTTRRAYTPEARVELAESLMDPSARTGGAVSSSGSGGYNGEMRAASGAPSHYDIN